MPLQLNKYAALSVPSHAPITGKSVDALSHVPIGSRRKSQSLLIFATPPKKYGSAI